MLDRMREHEQVVIAHDADSGLRCIVAIHSTALGPALGGTRFRPYASDEAALDDVLRLARAMTLKAATAGLDLGGGKAVIVGDPATSRTEALLRAYGRVVAELGGRYVTACDVGTRPEDLAVVGRETRWATGRPRVDGGAGDSGEPTAQGVLAGLRATVAHVFGDPGLAGRHIAVLGLGKVGGRLARALLDEGARLTVADVDEDAVAAVAARGEVDVVDPDEIVDVDADVLSPNALGGLLSSATIPRLAVRAVCGGANNQLASADDAWLLHERGIVHAPDHVVNAGGIIAVADELEPGGFTPARVAHRLAAIGTRTAGILAAAESAREPPDVTAERLALKRIASVGAVRRRLRPPTAPIT